MARRQHDQAAGGGSLVNRLGFMHRRGFTLAGTWLGFLLSLLMLLAAGALAQSNPATPETPESPETRPAPRTPRALVQARDSLDQLLDMDEDTRDSLLIEIQRYSGMVNAMQDSLNLSELGLGLELGPEQKESLRRSIDNFTSLIEEIGSELGQMDLEIVDNRISLLDKQGEGIVIDIPENLDEHLSEGLNVLSKIILAELPDSLHVGGQIRDISFHPFGRKEKRKVHTGNLFRVGDPLQVARNQDIRGHVVSVFGNAEVSGRVEGNVVVVFGDLQLGAEAEVTGKVVAVGGRLAQDPDAEVADVVVVDPWSRLGVDGPDGIFQPGMSAFLVGQGEFLATSLLAVLAVLFVPARRLERSREALGERPLMALLAGLLGSVGLHLVALLVMAVLVATVIGIPVALLVAVGLVLLAVASVALAALVLGRRLCLGATGRCGQPWVQVLIGLLVLHLVSLVGQFMGLWSGLSALSTLLVLLGLGVKSGAYLLGLGALLISRLGSAKGRGLPS